jgi:hypothetical protein
VRSSASAQPGQIHKAPAGGFEQINSRQESDGRNTIGFPAAAAGTGLRTAGRIDIVCYPVSPKPLREASVDRRLDTLHSP